MSVYASRLSATSQWDDVEVLVAEKVAESQRLEFKRELPPGAAPNARDTIRKDAVAMANGGGGVIVYGIEEGGDGRAAKFAPQPATAADAVRLRDVLAHSIEPPLRPEVFVVAGDGEAVVVVRVDGSVPRAIWPDKDASPEYWIRRDTSVRPMSPMEISRAFGGSRGGVADQLASHAIWALRGVQPPDDDIFLTPDTSGFERYFDETEALLTRSHEAALVLEELGHLWERHYTDAVRWGGFMQNFRTAATRFAVFLEPGIRRPEDDDSDERTRIAWASFRHFVEFAFAYSYEGSRGLDDADLLIALGAELLGEAVGYAVTMKAPAARTLALETLDDQAQHYTGELAECFAFARRRALSEGRFTEVPPRLARVAREGPDNPLLLLVGRRGQAKRPRR